MQAEVLTFQKWSRTSSASLAYIFLVGSMQMREMVQQAALRMLLSWSYRHLETASVALAASGLPILPSSIKAISLTLIDLFLS